MVNLDFVFVFINQQPTDKVVILLVRSYFVPLYIIVMEFSSPQPPNLHLCTASGVFWLMYPCMVGLNGAES